MKRMASLIPLLATVLMTASTADAIVTLQRSGNESVVTYLQFSSDPTNSCIQTAIYILPSKSATKNNGPTDHESGLDASLIKFDACSGNTIVTYGVHTDLAANAFKMMLPNLNKASLDADFSGTDSVTGAPVPVNVHVTWTGTGDLSRLVDNQHTRSGGFILISHSTNSFRTATIAGTVAFAGTTYDTTQAGFADNLLVDTKDGSVTINR
jgi:hypothetical protein